MAQMLVAGRDLESEMRCRAGAGIPARLMLPQDHPASQHPGIDLQCVAHRLEAERVLIAWAGRDPALGIDIKHAFPGTSGHHALLIDVDRVSQQRQHQALFAGQAMTAGQVEILRRENLVQADRALDGYIRAQLEAFRHVQRPEGCNIPGKLDAPTGPHRPR